MFIKRYGSGPRLFFGLHGWSGTHRTFEPLLRNLPPDVSFYAADLPGCGQSPAPAGFTLPAIAAEIGDALRRLPGPVTLVGNCSGALLGILAANTNRGNVERMLLIDLFAAFPWYFRVFLTPVLGPVAYYSTFANPLGRWLANASLRRRRSAETTLTGGFQQTSHSATRRYLKLFDRYPPPETFRGLAMPIHLVHGDRTFAAVAQSIPVWTAVWPHAQTSRLPGAGHLPILEATAPLREILFSCPIPTPSR